MMTDDRQETFVNLIPSPCTHKRGNPFWKESETRYPHSAASVIVSNEPSSRYGFGFLSEIAQQCRDCEDQWFERLLLR